MAAARKSSAGTLNDDPSKTYVAQFPITRNEFRADTLMEQAYKSRAQEMEEGQSIIEKELHHNDVISKKLLPKLTEITDYLEKNKVNKEQSRIDLLSHIIVCN